MASKTITAFERVVLLFDKTFVCTNRSARRLCASQCFYIQHAECAADIILSFGRIRTTPVRGYWTVGFSMDVYSRQKIRTFLYQEPVSRAEKSRLVFCFILLSLPGNLKSFLHETQKILSLFTELFTSPANASVNKFLALSPEMCTSLWNIPGSRPEDPHH